MLYTFEERYILTTYGKRMGIIFSLQTSPAHHTSNLSVYVRSIQDNDTSDVLDLSIHCNLPSYFIM